MDPAYAALAADRMGDAYALQNKRSEAIDAYTKAFNTMDATQPYRQMVASKLAGFGVDVANLAAAATTAAAPVAQANNAQATAPTNAAVADTAHIAASAAAPAASAASTASASRAAASAQ